MNAEYNILYRYLDALLRVQSSAAEMFEHSGVLGAVREHFLVQQIVERIDNAQIHTGQIIANNVNAGQVDILIRKRNTLNPAIGGQVRIVASDCASVIEVKSNATGTDFQDFNIKAAHIKEENPNVVCGFFCYRLDCRKDTILKRFGYRFDKEYQSFEEASYLPKLYPHIDFVVCVDEREESVIKTEAFYNKFFFLSKKLAITSDWGLVLSPPFSFYFLSEIQSHCSI